MVRGVLAGICPVVDSLEAVAAVPVCLGIDEADRVAGAVGDFINGPDPYLIGFLARRCVGVVGLDARVFGLAVVESLT